jgi:hypothetical protein
MSTYEADVTIKYFKVGVLSLWLSAITSVLREFPFEAEYLKAFLTGLSLWSLAIESLLKL